MLELQLSRAQLNATFNSYKDEYGHHINGSQLTFRLHAGLLHVASGLFRQDELDHERVREGAIVNNHTDISHAIYSFDPQVQLASNFAPVCNTPV